MTGRIWHLRIPAPAAFLTANTNPHWAVRAKLVRAWRGAAATIAKASGLPTGVDRIRIDAEFRFMGRAPVRDRDNLRPTLKAIVDGLTPPNHYTSRTGKRRHNRGHGLIPDDSDRHLDGPYLTIGDPLPARLYAPAGEVVLTIREVLNADS